MKEDMVDDFETFVLSRSRTLLRLAVLLTRDGHSAEDLLQDVLEKACLRWQRIRAMEDPEAYVRRMLANRAIDRWRLARFSQVPLESTHDRAVLAGPGYEVRDALLAALRSLPPRQRAAVVLRHCEGMSEAETARTLSCTVGTVKSSTSKGLTKLRAALADDFLTLMEGTR